MARLIILVLIFSAASTGYAQEKIENSILTRFYRITPELYRSGQPNSLEMKELEAMGIRSVLNLRQHHTDNDEARGTALMLYHIRMRAGNIQDEEVAEALHIINTAPKPILVHCWHGSDRTGTIIALYRILYESWSKEAALEELMRPEFGHHKRIYANIPTYIRDVDTEKLKTLIEAWPQLK